MIYLFSQIAISLGLAAIVGAALGWIVHRARSGKQIRSLQQVVTRQQQQVSQAQTEVSILTDDFDDLKAHSASQINALTVDNQKIPALNQNLEKSQLLVRQLMQKHTAEIGELESANEKLVSKSKQVNDREREFTKLQAELDIERRKNGKPSTPNSEQTLKHAAGHTKADTSAHQQTELGLSTDDKDSSIDSSSDSSNGRADSPNKKGVTTALAAGAGTAGLAAATVSANAQSNTIRSSAVRSSKSDDDWSSKSVQDVASKEETEAELKALRDQLAEPVEEVQEKPVNNSIKPSEERSAPQTGIYDAGRPHNLDETTVDEEELEQLFDPVDQQDDLKQIFGIGPVTEKTLNKLGITAYSQLAELKQHDIEKIADALQIFPGRIERDNWVGGARAQLEEVLEDL